MDSVVLFNRIGEFGSEGHRELARDIALIMELYDLSYVESEISDQDLKVISQILSDNLSQGLGMGNIMRDLTGSGLNSRDSEKISRTEVVRIKNLTNWYIYKKKGFSRFKVDFTKEACNDCVSRYKDKIFLIDDISNLPPVHDLCMCASIYLK